MKAENIDESPSSLSRKLENSIYTIVGIGSVVFILIGILILLFWPVLFPEKADSLVPKLVGIFFSELGFAGLISLILIFTIEKFTRERHQKAADSLMERINDNLFKAVYNRYIPDSVFSEVEKCLLCSDVLRTNYEIYYTLNYLKESIPESKLKECQLSDEDIEDHMLCEILSSYTLKNITGKEVTQPVEIFLEAPIDENVARFVRISEITIGDETFSEEAIAENTSKDDVHVIFKTNTHLKPDSYVDVQMKCCTVKKKVDMEVWASRVPSDGLTLHVKAPKSISVHASANHSECLKKSSIDNAMTIWRLNYGIFPFQSVVFWWKAE